MTDAAELIAHLKRSKANGDPNKYAAFITVAEAHEIARLWDAAESRATAAEGRVALLKEERDEAREAWRQSQAALEPLWGPWTTHRGRHDPPIDGDELVMVLFRDNDQAIGRVHDWDHNWQWTDDDAPEPGNIIMYRSLADARARLAKGGQ
jgi:hypothetical protein